MSDVQSGMMLNPKNVKMTLFEPKAGGEMSADAMEN